MLSMVVASMALTAGACQRNQPPPTPPPAPVETGASLVYQAPAEPLQQRVELLAGENHLDLRLKPAPASGAESAAARR